MTAAFTPGPWHVEIVKGSYQRPALVVGNDKTVAQCIGNQLEPDATSIREATANAYLISAAPDLYEALDTMLTLWDAHCGKWSVRDRVADCRAALAKASPGTNSGSDR